MHKVHWKIVFQPKGLGGLGIRQMQQFNKAMIGEITRRVITNEESLAIKVLKGKFLRGQDKFVALIPKQGMSRTWRSIVMQNNLIHDHTGWNIFNGSKVRFRRDKWLGKCRLMDDTMVDFLEEQL